MSASGPRGCLPLVKGGPVSGLGGVSLWSGEMSASGLGGCNSRPEADPLPETETPYADTPLQNACWDTHPAQCMRDTHTPCRQIDTCKTLPSQTMFVSGDNLFTFTIPVYYLVFDDTYSLLEFLKKNGWGNRDGVAPGVIPAGSRCEILSWILLRRRYGGYHQFHLIGICRPFVSARLKESGSGGSKTF